LRVEPRAWALFVLGALRLPSPEQPGGPPRGPRLVDRHEWRWAARSAASGDSAWRRPQAPARGRHVRYCPGNPCAWHLVIQVRGAAIPCLPARQQRGVVGSEDRRGPPRSRSTRKVPERFPGHPAPASRPMMAAAGPWGRDTRPPTPPPGIALPGQP
jgi:hypothetical protein